SRETGDLSLQWCCSSLQRAAVVLQFSAARCSGAAVLCSALQRLCSAFFSGPTRSHLRFHSSAWDHCATASTYEEVDSSARETLIFCQDRPYIGKNNAVVQ